MKIGIDISQIVYGGGVSIYTHNLVKTLLKIDRVNEYHLFFSSLRRKLVGFKARQFKLPPTLLDLLWNRWHLVPIESLIGQVDVFHASDWTQPPAKRAKLVTTIHDLSFLRWPQTVPPKVWRTQKRRLRWVKKEARVIIAVSRATKKETIELLGIPSERIRVIYEGVPQDVLKFKIQDLELKGLKKKLGVKKPYLLAYGSRAPRKNIKRLIRAFALAKRIKRGYQLVITGDYRPEEQLPPGVILTGFLPRQQMLTLFAGAEVFVYAFALGIPVVTSNLSSMPEIAGKAACLVDPASSKAIAEGVEQALRNKEKLVQKGRQRLRSFSWEKAARQTIKVYQRAVQ